MHSDKDAVRAQYADGRTAASRAASVQLGPVGLEIKLTGEPIEQVWPYPELQTGTPLGRHSSEALIRRGGAGAAEGSHPDVTVSASATIYVADQDFVRMLVARAPHLTGRAERWRFLRPALLLVLIAAGLWGVVWIAGLEPMKGVARLLPPAAWHAVGDKATEELTGKRRLCVDPQGQAALNRLVTKLTDAAQSEREFDVRVVEWDLVNAFTVPGGRIILTSKLIDSVTNLDELAGVISHEMGHALEYHPETSVVRGLGLSAVIRFAFGGLEPVSNVGMLLLQLRYSREAERSADERAVEIMRRAKVPAKALADFFVSLRKRESQAGTGRVPAFEILSTHPPLEDRAKMIERIPTYPAEPSVSPQDGEALKAICTQR